MAATSVFAKDLESNVGNKDRRVIGLEIAKIMILLRALNCLVPWRIHRQNFLLKAQRGQIPLDSNSHSVEVRPDTKSESGLVDGFPSMNISPARDTCTVFISFIISRLVSGLLPCSYRRLHSTMLMM